MHEHNACHPTQKTRSLSLFPLPLFPQVFIKEHKESLRFQMEHSPPPVADRETLKVGFVGGGGRFWLLYSRTHSMWKCQPVTCGCVAKLHTSPSFQFCTIRENWGAEGGGRQSPEVFGACVSSRPFWPRIDKSWYTKIHSGRWEWSWLAMRLGGLELWMHYCLS